MRRCITLILALCCLPLLLLAQLGPKQQTYPKTLTLKTQEFAVLASNAAAPFAMTAVVGDTVDLGNDGYPGAYALVLTGKDSVRVNYTNVPFDQWVFIPMNTPRGRATYRLRFNGVAGQFSDEYVRTHMNTTGFAVPEVYELANILWTLSAHGKKNSTLPKSGPYYDRVMAHFKPFMAHPVFAAINQITDNFDNYYDFRENSYTYHFEGDKLAWTGPHYAVWGDVEHTYQAIFHQLLPQIEDFARRSGYRAFYKKEQPYYQQLIKQQAEQMPIRKMWDWLEARFSQRFESYQVVFSPLIGGSHSTQQFARIMKPGLYKDRVYNEAVMFVDGPEQLLGRSELTDQQRQGLASGVVFTEIDHNYVNPITSRFRKRVDSIFSDRKVWT